MRKRKIASAVAYVLIFAIAIALFNGTTSFAAETIASGTCGENATWTLDSDGLLVISGTGETSAFQCDEGQWVDYKDKVKRVDVSDGVTSIGKEAFKDCLGLTSVMLPDSVTSIGDYAFSDCNGLKTITIFDNITSIGTDAFSGCSSLTTKIPNNVVCSEESASDKCSSIDDRVYAVAPSETIAYGTCGENATWKLYSDGLLVVSGSGDMSEFVCTKGNWYSNKDKVKKVIIEDGITSICSSMCSGCRNLKELSIPKSVLYIDYHAFSNCNGLKIVSLENGLRTIGAHAFARCVNLETIVLPDSVESIDYWAFEDCIRLENVHLSKKLKSIGMFAFEGCSELGSVDIPYGVKKIDSCAFGGCSSIKTIVIPSSVTDIGVDLFQECSSLESVSLPSSIRDIKPNMFDGCVSLSSINIPGSIEHIGEYAFNGCNSLTSITIPKSVFYIYDHAFYDCKSLNKVVIPDSVWGIEECVFEGCEKLDTITIEHHGSYAEKYAKENGFNVKALYTHIYKNPTFKWSANGSTCTVTYTCSGKSCGTGKAHTDTHKCTVTKAVLTPATTTKNGVTRCTAVTPYGGFKSYKNLPNINKIGSMSLNVTKATYTGKEIKPTVKVVDSAGKVINPKYYTVTYVNNNAVGKATVKVVFNTLYKGTLTKTFTIVPKNTAISEAASPAKGSINAKWALLDTNSLKQMTGYMIQVSTDPKFQKNVKNAFAKKPTITTNTIKGLKKGKYYVRIRTYKTINKTNYYSNWKNYNKAVVVK